MLDVNYKLNVLNYFVINYFEFKGYRAFNAPSEGKGNRLLPYIFQEKLIQYWYNFLQLLNNLSQISLKLLVKKTADIISCVVSHFVTKKYKKTEEMMETVNTLSASSTKWSNTLKQFVPKLPTNCLSVLDHFVILALKGLKLNDLLNFKELSGKIFLMIMLKVTNKTRLHPLFGKQNFGKTIGAVELTP